MKSLNVFCTGLKKEDLNDGFYNKKIYNYNFVTNFVIKNIGLFPDSDGIRIHKQAGSGSGFSEYETLIQTRVALSTSVKKTNLDFTYRYCILIFYAVS